MAELWTLVFKVYLSFTPEACHQGDKLLFTLIDSLSSPWSEILLSSPATNFSLLKDITSLIYFFYSLQTGFYVIFLLLLSYSLMYGSTRLDPTLYKGAADSLRGFCEILTLVMVVLYACEEINQIRK